MRAAVRARARVVPRAMPVLAAAVARAVMAVPVRVRRRWVGPGLMVVLAVRVVPVVVRVRVVLRVVVVRVVTVVPVA